MAELEKVDANFQFDEAGKIKVRDLFYDINVIKTRSKAADGPRSAEFIDGVLTTYNDLEPRTVLWSSRKWDVDGQEFDNPKPNGPGPFTLAITKGKQLAIVDANGQVVWAQDPNYEDFSGRLD